MFFHSHCWHKLNGSEYAVPLTYEHNKFIYEEYENGAGASGFVKYAYEAKFECCKCKEIVTRSVIDYGSDLTYKRHPYKKKNIEKVPKDLYEFEDHKLKKYYGSMFYQIISGIFVVAIAIIGYIFCISFLKVIS